MTRFRLRTWGKWEGYQNLNIMHFNIAMQCWRKLAIPLHSLCLQVDKLSWHHTDHRHLKVWTQGSCIVSEARQWRNQRVLLNFYWWVKWILLFLWHNFTLPSFCKWEDMTESKLRNWICVACSIGCTFLKAWALLAWITFIFLQCFLEDLICLLQNSRIDLPCLDTICMYTQYRELMLDYMSPFSK
jgi:hypothetical protein